MSGPGYRAASGDRVVDRVQTGRSDVPGRLVAPGLLGETEHEVVQVGEELVRGQVDVCESAYRGTQSAHGRRCLDPVPDHVAHDEAHPCPGERDDIEPVAAHSGAPGRRQIAAGDLHGTALRQLLRQQAALERQRGLPLLSEPLRVVQAHRAPRHDLPRHQYVVGGERIRAAVPKELRDPQCHPASRQRHRKDGVHPELPGVPCPHRLLLRPGAEGRIVLVQHH